MGVRSMLVAGAVLGGVAMADGMMAATSDYVPMPNGMAYHRSCVHHHDEHFHHERLAGGRYRVGAETFPPCPFPPRQVADEVPVGASYYSDWSVYTETFGKEYNYMTSSWEVPPIPQRNQGGLSSVYLFNGLQDGNGVHGQSSLILQPVLLYGKSGCLPLAGDSHKWHLGSYLVDGGRAHCGKHFVVQPGQTVIGTMTKIASGNETWSIESIALPLTSGGNNVTSSYTAHIKGTIINAAFLTLEGMIIYNCQSYPAGGGVTFKDVILGTKDGLLNDNNWTPVVRHDDCAQHTSVNDHAGKSVSLLWDSTVPK